MNWYSVGLAGVSGGLAVLIASMIFGKKPDKWMGYTIVVVILFVGFNVLSKKFILPELNIYKVKSDIESGFENIPAFASIKKYEPETYQILVNTLTEATQKGYSKEKATALVRTQISSLIESRLPHASDEAILTYINVIVAQMGELQSQGGGLCYKLLFPKVGDSINGRKVFSIETQNKSLAALDEIIKTSNKKRVIPAESEVLLYLEPIIDNLYKKYGDDVLIIDNPTAGNVDKEKVCSITKDLYMQIVQLPVEQAVFTLRWVFD